MTSQGMFYICDENGCHKRYKTWIKFETHRRTIHNKRNCDREDYIQIGSLPLVKKYSTQWRLTKKTDPMNRNDDTSNAPRGMCCICFDTECNTVCVPCGHLSFCLACIEKYHREYPNKGCPMCNKEILFITQIYTNTM